MEPKTAGIFHLCAAASARDRSRSQTAAIRTRSGWCAYPSKCSGETPPQPMTAMSNLLLILSTRSLLRARLHIIAGQLGIFQEHVQGLFVSHVIALSHPLPDLAALLDEGGVALEQQVQHIVIQRENRKVALFLGLQDERLGTGLLQHRS